MTTITITLPRAVVEQALEALRFYAEESHHLTLTGFKNGKRIDWDQERDRLEKAGYRFAHENHNSTEAYVEDGRRARDALNNLEEALAQQAEPVEPVGRVVSANCEYATVQWLKQTSDVGGGAPKNSRSWPIAGDAVYTAPPQRLPLTEDEAWLLIEQDYRMEEYGDAAMELIRRTEQAHGIMEEK